MHDRFYGGCKVSKDLQCVARPCTRQCVQNFLQTLQLPTATKFGVVGSMSLVKQSSHLQSLKWHLLFPSEAAAAAENEDDCYKDHGAYDASSYGSVESLPVCDSDCT